MTKQQQKTPSQWRDTISSMMKSRSKTIELEHISEATGVSIANLKMIEKNKTNNPGIASMEAIYNYLKSAQTNSTDIQL